MLLKAKSFSSLSLRSLSNFRRDGSNYFCGVTTELQYTFCTVPEGLDMEGVTESPELPGWVKFSETNKGASNSEDEDFVPPSMLYWIDNHKTHDRDAGIKDVVFDVVESDTDEISKVLKNNFGSPDLVVNALDSCLVDVSEGLIERVLKRFSCEWIPAFGFFKWAESLKGVKHSPDMYDLMVDNLGKTRKFDVMWELVEEMSGLGYFTLDTLTKVARRFAKAGKFEDAIEAFRKMERFGLKKDITAMNMLMDALVKNRGGVEYAERVFLEFKKHIAPNSQTFNVLVHGWCKIRRIDKAKRTSEIMKVQGFPPDSVTYTCFIEAYCREKDFSNVNATLEEMRKTGFRPTVVTYTIIITALAKSRQTDKAIEVYKMMKQENCSVDAPFCNAFMLALKKGGRLKDCDAVFDDMPKQGTAPDVTTFNAMIKTATEFMEEEKALKLLLKMEESGVRPDLNTYAPLLKMCCKLNRMKILSFLLDHMFKNDVSIDLGTYSMLVVRLCNRGVLERACSIFEEMVIKGFVPVDYTCLTLLEKLEKKGMEKEKQHIEELMSSAKTRSMVSLHESSV